MAFSLKLEQLIKHLKMKPVRQTRILNFFLKASFDFDCVSPNVKTYANKRTLFEETVGSIQQPLES